MFVQERESAMRGTAESTMARQRGCTCEFASANGDANVSKVWSTASTERRLLQVEIFEMAVDLAEARPASVRTSGLLVDVQTQRDLQQRQNRMKSVKKRFNKILQSARR